MALEAAGVVRVDDEHNGVGVLVVVAPEGADLVLAADVPHREVDVLVHQRFHVESDGGYRRDDLSELELVENGGLARGVKADHQDPALLPAAEGAEELADEKTHAVAWSTFGLSLDCSRLL